MKKLILLFSILSALVASAGEIYDVTVFFSTPGPDTYADGTTVRDGERYALVWSAGTFAGFKADGTLVNSEDRVFVIAGLAKDGKCRLTSYNLAYTNATLGGTISLVLLDTRVYGANGEVSFAAAEGTAKVASVAASAPVSASISLSTSGGDLAGASAAVANATTAVPTDAPQPVVKDFRVDSAAKLVYVTVENTASYLTYDLKAGATPSDLKAGAAKTPVTGGGEITLVSEMKDDQKFFRVNRK